MFYTDEPGGIDAYMKLVYLGTPRPAPSVRMDTAEIRGWLKAARAGTRPPERTPPTIEECRGYLRANAQTVAGLLDSQDDSGVWVRPRNASYAAAWGDLVHPYDQNALQVLRYIERSRMVLGELPLKRRGEGRQILSAFPGSGWYDTPLKKR